MADTTPTVRDLLAIPAIAQGRPVVVGGHPGLDTPVRWVHVSESTDLRELVRGGELVLTTGLPLLGDADGYLRMLADLDVAALIVELGTRMSTLPDGLAASADELGVPVITVARIPFVEVTEQAHRLIVADRFAELEFAHATHEAFTSLNINRATTAADIVTQAARMLDSPVVLEDLHHRVLVFDPAGSSATDLLAGWASRSRQHHDVDDQMAAVRVADGSPGRRTWTVAGVGAGPERWGRLILPHDLGTPTRNRLVLERAAQALHLHRMVERDRDALVAQASGGLLDDLISGRVAEEADARARAVALGLADETPGGLRFLPLAIRAPRTDTGDGLTGEEVDRRILTALRREAIAAGATVIGAVRGAGTIAAIVVAPQRRPSTVDELLEVLCRGLADAVGRRSWAAGTAASTGGLVSAARALAEADHVAEVGTTMTGPRRLYRSGDVRLRGLISLLRTDHRVQAFAEAELGALLEYDARTGQGLVDVLRVLLQEGGSKTAAARTTGLSRPTLYSRVARIEKILGVSLETVDSRTSLSAALMILDAGS